ncbi:MarR family winged helix-turn-helix transcriptional regulator [Microbacterium sp.]|uniref:MarR family winged helix-turn-helix transcriptional regulator n=1 Tax=Microbacterium sp. TaxID=51671 RepID=UPI002634F19A|nr:MarR family transcriptional regulator [uncultured Microbacterium sp.]
MDDNERIDTVVGQWAAERPDVDLAAMTLMARLSHAADLVNARIERLAKEYGVSRADGDVVLTLRRSGEPYRLSPTAIARSLLMTTGTMTGRLDRLEKLGLIARVPNDTDRRGVDIQLTPEGLRQSDIAITRHNDLLKEISGLLTPADRIELDQLTRQLVSGIGALEP